MDEIFTYPCFVKRGEEDPRCILSFFTQDVGMRFVAEKCQKGGRYYQCAFGEIFVTDKKFGVECDSLDIFKSVACHRSDDNYKHQLCKCFASGFDKKTMTPFYVGDVIENKDTEIMSSLFYRMGIIEIFSYYNEIKNFGKTKRLRGSFCLSLDKNYDEKAFKYKNLYDAIEEAYGIYKNVANSKTSKIRYYVIDIHGEVVWSPKGDKMEDGLSDSIKRRINVVQNT